MRPATGWGGTVLIAKFSDYEVFSDWNARARVVTWYKFYLRLAAGLHGSHSSRAFISRFRPEWNFFLPVPARSAETKFPVPGSSSAPPRATTLESRANLASGVTSFEAIPPGCRFPSPSQTFASPFPARNETSKAWFRPRRSRRFSSRALPCAREFGDKRESEFPKWVGVTSVDGCRGTRHAPFAVRSPLRLIRHLSHRPHVYPSVHVQAEGHPRLDDQALIGFSRFALKNVAIRGLGLRPGSHASNARWTGGTDGPARATRDRRSRPVNERANHARARHGRAWCNAQDKIPICHLWHLGSKLNFLSKKKKPGDEKTKHDARHIGDTNASAFHSTRAS
jgi:hypothetical protein